MNLPLFEKLFRKTKQVYPLNKSKTFDFDETLVISKKTGRMLLLRRKDVLKRSLGWGMVKNFQQNDEFIKYVEKSRTINSFNKNKTVYQFSNVIALVDREYLPVMTEDIQNYKWVMYHELGKIKLHTNLKQYFGKVGNSLQKFYKKYLVES